MTICDACNEHVQRRFYAYGKEAMALINLSPSKLKQLSVDDLTKVYDIAKNGAMVCGDCKELCRKGELNCTAKQLQAHDHRVTEDRRVMQAVLAELDRRINVKETLAKVRRT